MGNPRIPSKADPPKCSICLDALNPSAGATAGADNLQQPYALRCMHPFHRACIGPWLQQHNECPECRTFVGNSALQEFCRNNQQQQGQQQQQAMGAQQ